MNNNKIPWDSEAASLQMRILNCNKLGFFCFFFNENCHTAIPDTKKLKSHGEHSKVLVEEELRLGNRLGRPKDEVSYE